MFDGYLSVGGNEIINAARTQKYVENNLPGFPLKRRSDLSTIADAVGDGVYESPLVDGAEWVSPSDSATHGFYGLYPISIEGVSDSTLSATITESLGEGGTVGEARDGTRSVRVVGLLVGRDELSAEAGFTWLRQAIKSDQCGSHGASCGSSDMTYFLAEPDVCDPKWMTYPPCQYEDGPGACRWDSPARGNGIGSSYVIGNDGSFSYDSVVPLGKLTARRSPLAYSMPVEASMPAHIEWLPGRVDGAVIRWGRMAASRAGNAELSSSAPILLQRTNYAPNPSFDVDLSSFTTVGADVQLTRVAEGGVDGGAFARIIDLKYPTTRTNWMPNSRFDYSPQTSGWRSNGLVTSESNGSVPYGDNAARFEALSSSGSGYGEGPYGQTGYGGLEVRQPGNDDYYSLTQYGPSPYGDQYGVLFAETTLIGPTGQPRTSTLSFYLTPNITAVVEIFNAAGVQIAAKNVSGGTSWKRQSITAVMGEGYGFRITTMDQVMRLNGFLLEEGTEVLDYFDGTFPDNPADFSDYFFLGEPSSSASRLRIGERSPYEIWQAPIDTQAGNLQVSFALRSRSSANVIVTLTAQDEDQTELARLVIDPQDNWQTYRMTTQYGRGVILSISGLGTVDLDQLLLESADSPRAFFDGSTLPAPGYASSWLGAVGTSPSRTTWTGRALIDYKDSDFRPYIALVEGQLPSVNLQWQNSQQISMDEQLIPYLRNFHRVSVTKGATEISRDRFASGAVAIRVEFILTAATPYAYSLDIPVNLDSPAVVEFNDTEAVITNIVENGRAQAVSGDQAIGWSGVSSSGRDSFSSRWVTWPQGSSIDPNPHGALEIGFTRESKYGGMNYRQRDLAPNVTYSFWGIARVNRNRNMQLGIEWLNAAAVRTGLDWGPARTVYGGDSILRVSAQAPAGTTQANIVFRSAPDGEYSWLPGDLLQVSCLFGVRGSRLTPYFDGDFADTETYTYSWTGARGDSTSTRQSTFAVEDTSDPLADPDCPPTPRAPQLPSVPDLCIDEYAEWIRRHYDIPADSVPLWATAVPTITFNTKVSEQYRQVRVRFAPNPFKFESEAVDPLSYCGEFIVSFMPGDTTFTVNGMTKRAIAQVGGREPLPADHLLYGTGGTPMTWPELSCAIDYVMTVDIPIDQRELDLDIAVALNRRE